MEVEADGERYSLILLKQGTEAVSRLFCCYFVLSPDLLPYSMFDCASFPWKTWQKMENV